DADLVGKHPAVRTAPSRQRYAAVQAEQRPTGGRVVLDDDLDVVHRRTELGRQWAQRGVNGRFERIMGTWLRTHIQPRNGARIGAGIETASSCFRPAREATTGRSGPDSSDENGVL